MKVHSDGMDTEQAFAEITKDIAEGRVEDVGKKVLDLIENDKTPYTLIKCMSLVKVIDDPETMKAVTTTLMNNLPEDDKVKIEVCGALRGLDHPMLAYSILKTMGDDDVILRLSAVCLVDLEEYESALEKIRSIREMQVNDRIVLTSILSSLGEHTDAVAIAEGLLSEYPKVYDVRASYLGSLLVSGRSKDAVKYVRACLKEKTADANALAAYVMRITGNVKAAGGYATRAIQMDNKHIGAMETLGICLAEKGEYDKARIVAGAINEVSPGNKAALNIISFCEGH